MTLIGVHSTNPCISCTLICHNITITCTPYRVELSSEDDLSPDSDSDTMDVDSTSLETTRRQGGPTATNGRAGTVAGALVPDTSPQFAVSQ